MRKTLLYLSAVAILTALFFTDCKKKPEMKIYNLEISDETVVTTTKKATITAHYSYPSEISDIKIIVSDNDAMQNARAIEAYLDDNTLSATVNNLSVGTKYYYCFRYYNGMNVVDTDNRSFTTNSQMQIPTGAINGLFSVGASKQVCFSQGNLQYKASTRTWRFAEHQYDYIGGNNSNISSSYNGWIDLFGWGTSGNRHGAQYYQPYNIEMVNSGYYAYGDFKYNLCDQTGRADWGYNVISNGGESVNTWRTLTNTEWWYVFNRRNTSSGIRYAKANVNGKFGIILLPDDWDTNTYSLNYPNTPSVGYNINTITAGSWSVMESAGAVFLPAAGYRYGSNVSYAGSTGYYWSASCYNSTDAHFVLFESGNLQPSSHNFRDGGRSVRLVFDVEE